MTTARVKRRWTGDEVAGLQGRLKRALAAVMPDEVAEPLAPAAKPPKYRNKRVIAGGVTYDSKAEYRNHQRLQLLEKAGVIRNLRHHVRYELIVNGTKVGHYTADHVYETREGNRWVEVTADTKSPPTRAAAAYRLRARLFAALFGRAIVEL